MRIGKFHALRALVVREFERERQRVKRWMVDVVVYAYGLEPALLVGVPRQRSPLLAGDVEHVPRLAVRLEIAVCCFFFGHWSAPRGWALFNPRYVFGLRLGVSGRSPRRTPLTLASLSRASALPSNPRRRTAPESYRPG